MKVYRIENPVTMHGMWYRTGGVYDPYIMNLTDGRSKDLPMDFDERYNKDGKDWYSAGKSIENMHEWFSALDAYELIQAGYALYELEVSEYEVEKHQVIFTRESIESRKEITLDKIWDFSEVA